MAKGALRYLGSTARTPRRPHLAEYSYVRLRHDIQAEGTTYGAGTRGVIVHRHDDGIAYEVEFESPVFGVITLTAQDIQADHG
jgi:Domain of unknown function (DUF4926)